MDILLIIVLSAAMFGIAYLGFVKKEDRTKEKFLVSLVVLTAIRCLVIISFALMIQRVGLMESVFLITVTQSVLMIVADFMFGMWYLKLEANRAICIAVLMGLFTNLMFLVHAWEAIKAAYLASSPAATQTIRIPVTV